MRYAKFPGTVLLNSIILPLISILRAAPSVVRKRCGFIFPQRNLFISLGKNKGAMATIIGREKEIHELNELYNSDQSQLVAVYGRRRVGKTFLIDEALRGRITFRHAGLSPVDEKGNKRMLKDLVS